MDKKKGSDSSKVRVGHSLNEAERQHVAKRREKVLQCLQQHNIPCSAERVPSIAVLGSGGGLRAMVGLLGSLNQLNKEGLLDCITYLSGVSGSTWCMASLYKEQDWSTKLETVKDNIAKRLSDKNVSWLEKGNKLAKYLLTKDNFSLTDIWAALIVSTMVNEIDEHNLTEQRGKHTNDPYPVYTVVDKQCKYDRMKAEPWFEITPDESGHSLTGAFVDSSCLGSRFKKGQKTKDQPEIDILHLQGLCGSAIADMEELLKALLQLIKEKKKIMETSRISLDVQSGSTELEALVEMNLCVLRGENCSVYNQTMNNFLPENKVTAVLKSSALELSKAEIQRITLQKCSSFFDKFGGQQSWDNVWIAIVRSLELITSWVWGTTYNFLNKMEVKGVHPSILSSETREYEDAGLLNNSPYFSMLRKERDIDLIISLDFSAGDPFETVVQTAKKCKELQIPFPEVVVPSGGNGEVQDFYVFRGYTKAPTVIHIPLFNCVNCTGEVQKWEEKYKTFQLCYSASMTTDLMEKAGLNIRNNKEKLLKEIKNVTEQKKAYKLG